MCVEIPLEVHGNSGQGYYLPLHPGAAVSSHQPTAMVAGGRLTCQAAPSSCTLSNKLKQKPRQRMKFKNIFFSEQSYEISSKRLGAAILAPTYLLSGRADLQ